MAQIKGEVSLTVAKSVTNSTASNISVSKFLTPSINSSIKFYMYTHNNFGTRLTSLPTYKFYYIDQGTKTQINDLSLVYDGNEEFHIAGNLNSYTFYYKPSTGESKSYDEWMNVIISLEDGNGNLFALSKQMPITFTSGGNTTATISIPSNTITVSNTPSTVTMTKTTEINLPYDISTNAHKFDNSFYASFVKAETGTNYQGAIYVTTGYSEELIIAPKYTFLADDSGYEAVEYIESTGTQYIDTGVIPSTTLKGEIELMPNTSYISEYSILGSTWSASGYFLMFYQSKIRFHSRNYVFDTTADATNSKTTIKFYSHNLTTNCLNVNGVDAPQTADYGDTADSSNTIHIFDTLDSGKRGHFKLYSCKFWNNDILVRDFIPAKRKADNVYGLYDQLNDVFYENAGTGAFTGAK